MIIKILGTGCNKCKEVEENLTTALEELKIDATVEKVEDIGEFVKYGVRITPGLVIDEKVVSASGKALSVEELKELLTK